MNPRTKLPERCVHGGGTLPELTLQVASDNVQTLILRPRVDGEQRRKPSTTATRQELLANATALVPQVIGCRKVKGGILPIELGMWNCEHHNE